MDPVKQWWIEERVKKTIEKLEGVVNLFKNINVFLR